MFRPLGDVEGGVVQGGLAGAHRERIDAALELRDPPLEHGSGRVADARIAIALDLEIKERRPVGGAVEGVGDRLVDRHRDRLGGRVGVEAGVQGDGFRFHRRARVRKAGARRRKSTIVICIIEGNGASQVH
jgi:hypothetical protein